MNDVHERLQHRGGQLGYKFLLGGMCHGIGIQWLEHMMMHKEELYNRYINKADSRDFTPLLTAAENGHVGVVTELHRLGANIRKANRDGVTPLWIAALKGHSRVVTKLCQLNADIDSSSNDGATPLFCAALYGHVSIVTELARLGAIINQAAHSGTTPLYGAAQNDQVDVVIELRRLGVDISASICGSTPLFIAAQNGRTALVNYLIQELDEVSKTIPFISSSQSLRAFAANYDEQVQQRMEEFILHESSLAGFDETSIALVPEKIASIMGHNDIVEALQIDAQFAASHRSF